MPLYGHELSPTITAVEARLTFAVSFNKGFIRARCAAQQKLEEPERVLVGFELVERGVPRDHYPVFKDGKEVGIVSTGMFSPTTDRYLGMAFVPRDLAAIARRLRS